MKATLRLSVIAAVLFDVNYHVINLIAIVFHLVSGRRFAAVRLKSLFLAL